MGLIALIKNLTEPDIEESYILPEELRRTQIETDKWGNKLLERPTSTKKTGKVIRTPKDIGTKQEKGISKEGISNGGRLRRTEKAEFFTDRMEDSADKEIGEN